MGPILRSSIARFSGSSYNGASIISAHAATSRGYGFLSAVVSATWCQENPSPDRPRLPRQPIVNSGAGLTFSRPREPGIMTRGEALLHDGRVNCFLGTDACKSLCATCQSGDWEEA